MSIENVIGTVEAALVRLVRLGLGIRYVSADLAALAAYPVAQASDGELRFVAAAGTVYEWQPYSTATADGVNVVAPASPPANKPNGRWHRVVTSWAFGAGGQNLAHRGTGYLRSVEAYSSDDGTDAAIDKVFGRTPSVLAQFQGDDPQPLSNLPGTFYRDALTFQLLIVNSNLRGAASGTQGSRVAADPDPGAYATIGDLRRLLCGVSPDSGVEGVERIEIGPARLEFEDVERRMFVHSLAVTVLASFSVEDEDLAAAEIWAQAQLAGVGEAETFDRQNFVASGCDLDHSGDPFAFTVRAGIAVVSGASVATADTPHTFAPGDTYRDLSSAGVWTFTAVPLYSGPPPVTPGCLRVAVSRADAERVFADMPLCSFSVPFGSPFRAA